MLIHNADITGSLLVNGTPFNTGSFSGSFTGIVAGTTATASYVEYNSVANKPTLVSGSSQITYSGLTGIPSGIVSGSAQVTYSGLTGIPSGIVSGSSQVTYSGLTGVPSGIVSGSSQVTYSGLTGVPSGIVSGSAQISDFGIFATTGSNGFNGSQSITGSLTVTGQVVAQTLNVQQVTSSIVYSSGSNIFGNSLANIQQFTGSVSITGSLNTSIAAFGSAATTFLTSDGGTIKSRTAAQTLSDIAALPLAGGTLTGTLNGTSASFSGNVGVGANPNQSGIGPSNRVLTVKATSSGGEALLELIGLGNNATDNIAKISFMNQAATTALASIEAIRGSSDTVGELSFKTSNTTRLTIASTGAATFSSSVSIGGADQGYQLDVKRTSTGDATFDTVANFYKASTHNTGLLLRLKNTIVDLAANNITGGGGPSAGMSFSVSSGGTISTALTLASTGAATFASSVTAASGVFTLATSGGAIGSVRNLTLANTSGTLNDFAGINFAFYNNGTNFGYIGSILSNENSNSAADLVFGVKASNAATSVSEYMRIKFGGNVGIGTSDPGYKTEVAGAVGNYWNGSAFTATPLALSISNTQAGGYDSVLLLQQTDSGGTTKLAGGIGLVGTGPWTAGNNASQVSDMYFLVKNDSGGISERMRIKSSGNVGIGTTSPNTKLQVEDGYISTYHNINANGAGFGIQFFTNGGASKNTIADIGISQVGTARSGDMIFSTSNAGAPTTRMTITSDSYLRMAASTGGIQFNGDTAAANALNDYEEGSFTPSSLGTDFSSISVTFGRYIKIGNQVTINCRWSVTPGSTGMKYVVFDLPFAFVNNSNIAFTGAVSNYNEGRTAGSSNVGTTTRNSSGSTSQQYVEAYYTSTNVSTLLLSMTYFTFY